MSDKPIVCYLASPYSHPDPSVRHQRFVAACVVADRLMRGGLVVFSPIAHSHSIEINRTDGKIDGGDFWLRQDFPLLDACDVLLVLKLSGWDTSEGMKAEEARARIAGKIIVYLMADSTAEYAKDMIERLSEKHDERNQPPEPESILAEAHRLTSVDRRETYGHPSDNFGRIAQMLNAYLGDKVKAPLDATDVGMMQALTKIARHGHSRKRDNLTDLCGYARCVSVCEGYEE